MLGSHIVMSFGLMVVKNAAANIEATTAFSATF